MGGILTAMAREAQRSKREREKAARAAEREHQTELRARMREQARADREAKERYLEDRAQEAAELTAEAAERTQQLMTILEHTLDVDDTVAFASLRLCESFDDWDAQEGHSEPPPMRTAYTSKVRPPKGLSRLWPGSSRKFKERMLAAETAYAEALTVWQKDRQRRKQQFEQKRAQRDAEVDDLERAYGAGDPEAIVQYNTLVLERSQYPEGCPQDFRIAYSSDSRQLVIEYELPTADIVPMEIEYRHVKTKDEITSKLRKPTEQKEIYQDLVAAIALRTLHEIFEADQGDHMQVVCFNGFVQTVDPATGRDIAPHLLSVQTTKERFLEIDLARVDKKVCLRNLGANVSARPAEAQPVKPVVDINMVDPRFVDQQDVLGSLDARPNLLDLSPVEFEALVANLFAKMGLETKLTRSSRDGGVDCVAFDQRPILGGKVVIQAKRYRNTVGVSAVRDLYGTMMNEGANKGILVATSGYGPDAFAFVQDKPIELIDGGALLYLLEQNGTRARIVMPDD
jgi:restriction system protein